MQDSREEVAFGTQPRKQSTDVEVIFFFLMQTGHFGPRNIKVKKACVCMRVRGYKASRSQRERRY